MQETGGNEMRVKFYASLGWRNGYSGLFFPKSGTVAINAMPDELIWEIGRRSPIRTLVRVFTVTLLHELTHWAGHNHDTPEDDYGWNILIERMIS